MDDNEFLCRIKTYIENAEVELDTHTGSHRKLQAMIDAGIMPPVYAEVLRRLQSPSPLVEWLEGDFKHACVHDVMRLREAIVMIQVGVRRGHRHEAVMGIAIACFVRGLIEKTQPTTVPVEGN